MAQSIFLCVTLRQTLRNSAVLQTRKKYRDPVKSTPKPEVALFHPSGALCAFWACFAINMPLLRSWIAVQGEGNPGLNTAHTTAVYMIVCPLI